MLPKLTNEMRVALSQRGGEPLTVEDEQTHKRYVLMPLEVYERVRAAFDDSAFDVVETYPAQGQAAGATGWDDPEMDAYDDYDRHRNLP